MHLIDVFRISSQPGGQPKPFSPSLKYIDVINRNFVSLALDPCFWELFQGLCALGKSYATHVLPKLISILDSVSDIDESFPPQPPPVKRASLAPEDI